MLLFFVMFLKRIVRYFTYSKVAFDWFLCDAFVYLSLVFYSLQMANRSIDVAPAACHQMNYVTASMGYEGDGTGKKVFTLLS